MADEVKLAIERVQAALDSADRLAPAGVAVVIERRNDLHTILGALTSRPLPTDEEVERAAKAIATKCYAVIAGNDDCGEWEEMPPRVQEVYREASRAALIAGCTP